MDWICAAGCTSTGQCSRDHGNKPSGSVTLKEFVDYLSDYQFLKKESPSHSWPDCCKYRPHYIHKLYHVLITLYDGLLFMQSTKIYFSFRKIGGHMDTCETNIKIPVH